MLAKRSQSKKLFLVIPFYLHFLLNFLYIYIFLYQVIPKLDFKHKNYEIYLCIYFCSISLTMMLCHLQAAFTHPGKMPSSDITNIENENIQLLQKINNNRLKHYSQIRNTNSSNRQKCNELNEITNDVIQVEDSQIVSIEQLPNEMKFRRCNQCNEIKPPRAHHCRICNMCVLRMNHHCIQISNCVGINNHKYFILYTLYSFLQGGLAYICYLFCIFYNYREIISSIQDNYLFIFGLILTNYVTFTSLFFLLTNMYLMSKNQTLLESKLFSNQKVKTCPNQNYQQNPYNLGNMKKNISQVMGYFDWKFFLPLRPQYRNDGIHYSLNPNYFNQ